MHQRHHQDSMNTFAHEKRRWGKGGSESISLAMSHWLHCFILFPGSAGFTSVMPPCRGETRWWKAWARATRRSKMGEQAAGSVCVPGKRKRALVVVVCGWAVHVCREGTYCELYCSVKSPQGIEVTVTQNQAQVRHVPAESLDSKGNLSVLCHQPARLQPTFLIFIATSTTIKSHPRFCRISWVFFFFFPGPI